MRAECDVAIVGGGVVGLAIAARLSQAGERVVLIERHGRLATETSARNSGVIHAGLYYAPGSLKATLCVRGRELLYDYCERRGVAHRRTGKLVLACEEREREALHALRDNAHANGVRELEFWDAGKLAEREPNLRAALALHVGESGIVDAHELAAALAHDAREAGASLALGTAFVGARPTSAGYAITTLTGDETSEITASRVVNAAGLDSDRVSAAFGVDVDREGLRLRYVKGDYFALASSAPRVSAALVYPLPQGAGLGVHLTSDLTGRLRAGPDTEVVDAPRYDVDEAKRSLFAAAVRRYLPGLRETDLSPDYAGIRPKLARGTGLGADFVLDECSRLGLPGFVQLVGIESPGLTAALAIGEEVARLLGTVP